MVFKCVCRRYLSLIELMVVIAIISLVAGIVGINISKSVQEQRFRSEVTQITDKLRLAQNLMLLLNEDVKVHFSNVEGGIKYWLSFQCPLDSGWDREITRPPPILTNIRRISFDGIGKEDSSDGFALNFLSAGMVMSQGVLMLETGEGRSYIDQKYITLPGFPAPISSSSQKPDSSFSMRHEDRENDQMTQFIMPDIISKFQSQKSSTPVEVEEGDVEKIEKAGKIEKVENMDEAK